MEDLNRNFTDTANNPFSHQNKCQIGKKSNFECPLPTIYFADGVRSVDFVLVWNLLDEEAVSDEARNKRTTFEENLVKEGLELEYEVADKNGLHFVKVNHFEMFWYVGVGLKRDVFRFMLRRRF